MAGISIPARGGLPPRALRQVREHVWAHVEQKISIQALASLVGLSKFHFCRAFKRSEGITPLRFVLRCRVTRVVHLLTTTELPISRIAFAAGFSDQSHCTRRFRELIGITPSRYRWLLRCSTVAESPATCYDADYIASLVWQQPEHSTSASADNRPKPPAGRLSSRGASAPQVALSTMPVDS
jgi:AraC-like DNA-binding protein